MPSSPSSVRQPEVVRSSRLAVALDTDAAMASVSAQRTAAWPASRTEVLPVAAGLGPVWPWYFDPMPRSRRAGRLRVVIRRKLIWPIFIPG